MRRTKELELDLGEVSNARQDGGRASDPSRTRDRARKNGGLPGQEADRCRSIRLSKILDPEPDRELDWALVFSIAESARTIGFLHPIAVRKVQVERRGKLRTRTVLVAGAHRLMAAHHLSYGRIGCVYIDYNDDTTAQLVQVGEDLFRKHVTVLRHAELVTKWYELVSKDHVYGQVDRKNKRGRPPGGVLRVARDLPLGTTVEARRKIIQRARKIARIQPEAEQAAIRAGLDDNQRALLAIAAANGRKAQLRKVAMLRRARSKANTDYVEFVRNVFQGRKEVYAKELYALAKRRGLSKKSVLMVLNGFCYHRKRSGYGSSGRYYYRNINIDWKEELVKVSEAELRGREEGSDDVGAETYTATRSEEPKEERPSQSAKKKEYWPDDDLPF
jgi:ParB-like chromosome segregation protein Spo0J